MLRAMRCTAPTTRCRLSRCGTGRPLPCARLRVRSSGRGSCAGKNDGRLTRRQLTENLARRRLALRRRRCAYRGSSWAADCLQSQRPAGVDRSEVRMTRAAVAERAMSATAEKCPCCNPAHKCSPEDCALVCHFAAAIAAPGLAWAQTRPERLVALNAAQPVAYLRQPDPPPPRF